MTGEPLAPLLPQSPPARRAGRSGAEHVRIIRGSSSELPGWVDPQTREQAEATLAGSRRGWVPRSCGRPPTGCWCCCTRTASAHRCRAGPAALPHHGPAGRRRDERNHGAAGPRSPRHPGCGAGQMGRPGHVQPRRRNPVCRRPTREAGRAAATCAPSRNATTTRSKPSAARAGLGTAGSAQRAAGHHHRVHHPQGAGVRRRAGRHRRRHPAADDRRDPDGQPRPPLPGDLRPAHRDPAVPRPHPRTASAGQRIVLYAKDRGCTVPGLHRAGLPMPGPPRHRLGQRRATDIDDLTLACGPTTACQTGGWRTRKRKDGRTEWIPHPTSTPAKPESTTTTTPRTICFPRRRRALAEIHPRHRLTRHRCAPPGGCACRGHHDSRTRRVQ